MKEPSSGSPGIELPRTYHADTIVIHEYWRAKCGERRMPTRADIDPTEIPPRILPGISIVQVVEDERRYVYRLIGTGEVEVRGNDPTGKSPKEAFFGPSAEDALACYDRVVETGAPVVDTTPFTAPNGRYVTEETIFLPLSEDDIHVHKILVFSYSRNQRIPFPDW